MTDTSQEIKDLQLKIWLSKSPAERLRQSIVDNEALFNFWNNVKPTKTNSIGIYTNFRNTSTEEKKSLKK